jgi:polyisoprenoid-binding protein YceI
MTSIKSLLVLVAASAVFLFLPNTAPVRTAAETMTVDMVHSSLVFKVKHMDTAHFWGRFNKFGGELSLDDKGGSVSIEIDAASIDSNNADRDTHLKNEDFLDVAKFPKLTFKSKTVTKKGEDWEVAGEMTMHGVTKPLTVTVKQSGSSDDPRLGKRVGYETEFTLKRSDYDLAKKIPTKVLGDEIKAFLSIEAAPKK